MNPLEWFQFVLSFALQASLLTVIACALERRCQTASVKTRIWSCYYLSVLCALAIGLLFPRVRWSNPWQSLSAPALLNVIHFELWVGRLLLAVWCIGSCVILVRWVSGFLQIRRFFQKCRLLNDMELAHLRSLTCKEFLRPLGRDVEFRVCPEDLGPFCYQLHQPVICFPLSLLQSGTGELKHVLEHELAHLRTQHPLQVFAQRLVQTTLWFLPVVWTAGRQASLAREFVCDDAATAQGVSAASYLRTLLRFAQQRSVSTGVVLAIARSTSELKVRAQRLASPRSDGGNRATSLAPATIVLAAIAASQIWLPTNPLASPNVHYSPWPAWSAAALHAIDVSVRDFDQYDARLQVYELAGGQRNLGPARH